MRTYFSRSIPSMFVIGLATLATTAFGWGSVAHQLINTAATDVMSSGEKAFFAANLPSLVTLATVPDDHWKSGPSANDEKPMHYFQWDSYSKSAIANTMPTTYADAQKLLGASFITTNGSTVWRVAQLFDKLVAAIKAHDCVTELQIAGVLGHYVGDSSMPMHLSSDYDGQSIGQPGVHSYFETKLIVKMDRQKLLDDTVIEAQKPHPELALGKPAGTSLDAISIASQEGKTAYASLAPLLDIFKQGSVTSPTSSQISQLEAYEAPLMGLGTAALAEIWDMASEQAGVASGCAAKAITVPIPTWMPLN